MMLAIGLSYISFIMLRYIPSISGFLKSFYHEVVLNLVEQDCCIYWDDHVVFVFASINVPYLVCHYFILFIYFVTFYISLYAYTIFCPPFWLCGDKT
jgi:hypothetical protein